MIIMEKGKRLRRNAKKEDFVHIQHSPISEGRRSLMNMSRYLSDSLHRGRKGGMKRTINPNETNNSVGCANSANKKTASHVQYKYSISC